jgi:hypothetical protein
LILTSSLSFAMHRVSHHLAPSRTALALDRAIRDAPPLFGLSSSSALLSLRDGVSIPRARTPTRGTGRRPPPFSRRTAKRSSAALGLPRSHSPPWRGKRTRHGRYRLTGYTHTLVLREEIRRERSHPSLGIQVIMFHGVANVTTQSESSSESTRIIHSTGGRPATDWTNMRRHLRAPPVLHLLVVAYSSHPRYSPIQWRGDQERVQSAPAARRHSISWRAHVT